ncbi:MAG: hypothetical protein RI911_927 [Candidatus Parcubacteria bacterium]|jgi:drug/metabolite transporter (DMT)-like permease
MSLGLLLALIPLVGWGLGDFLIQKTTRSIGVFKTLFFICVFSVPVLFPFVYAEFPLLTLEQLNILTAMSFVVFVYALVLFEAFRVGKISVVESIVAIELPLTVFLAVFVGGETMQGTHLLLFAVVCVGVLLASMDEVDVLRQGRRLFEKGVLIALAAAVLSACANYSIGASAQNVSPLMAIWYSHAVIGCIAGLALYIKGEFFELVDDFKAHPWLISGQSVCDNAAWVGYAYAVTYLPISLVITISESYIILAALLGYWIGKEHLHIHQKIGAAIALPAVILFAILMS